MTKKQTWDEYYLGMAELVAQKSKDRSTKVGAVIVGPDNEVRSTGFNGFPRGIDDDIDERHERPAKYMWTEHSERNAIYNAARVGIPTKGCTMYLNFEPQPCSDCTRAVIQAGIIKIVGTDESFTGKGKHWVNNLSEASIMLKEAGIEIVIIPKKLVLK